MSSPTVRRCCAISVCAQLSSFTELKAEFDTQPSALVAAHSESLTASQLRVAELARMLAAIEIRVAKMQRQLANVNERMLHRCGRKTKH